MNAGLSMSEVMEGGATAGGLLREAREAAGMHIAALAVALKVPVSKLEALEAGNYESLPDTVFVRALASSVCRTLKMDAAPILALLPQSQNPRLAMDSRGLNAPVKSSAGKLSSSSAPYAFSSTSKSVTLVVLALLVGAVGVFFFPRQHDGGPAGAPEPEGVPSTVALAPATVNPGPDTLGQTASSLPPTAAAAATPAASALDAGVAQVPAPMATASEPSGALAADPAGTLVLRARGESWVQVRDASGAVVLQRNLAAQESVAVNAPGPLAVVVGRADATEVFVRGKPFDLAGVSRENVARFEVK